MIEFSESRMRPSGRTPDAMRVGDLQLDAAGRTVSRAGMPIQLGRREFVMLRYLMQHVGEVVTRSMLLEAAWSYDAAPHGNMVDMHIYRLRRKIDDGFSHRLLHTVPGAGYMIRHPEENEPTG